MHSSGPRHSLLKSTPIRLALAFGLFLTILAVGAAYILKRPKHSPKVAHNNAHGEGAPKSDSPDEFFYSTVGEVGSDDSDQIGAAPGDERGSDALGQVHADRMGSASFTLEFDVFRDRENAEKLIDDLRQKGIDAYFTPLSRAGHVVFRVRRGIYPSRKEAEKASVAMNGLGGPPAKIVKLQ